MRQGIPLPLLLSLPTRFHGTNVDVSECIIDADTASVREKFLRILGYFLGRYTAHLDIRCHSVLMLRICSAAYALVASRGAVGRGDSHRLAKMISDLLQDFL